MSKRNLSIAVGDYDRVRPLVDGTVRIDGDDPVFMLLEPGEIFFRAFRHEDFDRDARDLPHLSGVRPLSQTPALRDA